MKYRKYENLVKKYINAEWSKLFNSICLNENLWPTYTNFLLKYELKNLFFPSKYKHTNLLGLDLDL